MMNMLRVKVAAVTAGILMSTGALMQPASAQVAVQGGLVNVTVQDIDIELDEVVNVENNNVNIVVAANIIAQVCGVTVPVNVLAQQIFQQGEFQCSVEDVDNNIETVLTATQTRGPR